MTPMTPKERQDRFQDKLGPAYREYKNAKERERRQRNKEHKRQAALESQAAERQALLALEAQAQYNASLSDGLPGGLLNGLNATNNAVARAYGSQTQQPVPTAPRQKPSSGLPRASRWGTAPASSLPVGARKTISKAAFTVNQHWQPGQKIILPLTNSNRIIKVNMSEDLCYGTMATRLIHQLIEACVGTKGGLEKSSSPGTVFGQVKDDLHSDEFDICGFITTAILRGRNKTQHTKWVFHLNEREKEPFKNAFIRVMKELAPGWKIEHENREANVVRATLAQKEAEVKNLNAALGKAVAEVERLKQQSSTQKLLRLEEENGELKMENTFLKEQVENLRDQQKKNDELNAELEEKNELIGALRRHNAELKKNNNNKRSREELEAEEAAVEMEQYDAAGVDEGSLYDPDAEQFEFDADFEGKVDENVEEVFYEEFDEDLEKGEIVEPSAKRSRNN